MYATSLSLHAYYTGLGTEICFFASFFKLAQAIAQSLPKFLLLMATHFTDSCTVMFVPWAQEQTEPWWQSPWKNAQNYFTQKQRFLLDSFINVTQTPFQNKQIYPPFKADNSNNSFCTLVNNSKLYVVASMSTVLGYCTNSSICYSHCYFLFKSEVQSPLPPGLKVHWLKRAEGFCALCYWPSGGTSTPEKLSAKYHLDVQLWRGPASLLSDFT